MLATKESSVKTRGAAFDMLLSLAERAESRAAADDVSRASAVRDVIVVVAAGLAGRSVLRGPYRGALDH